jgi:hypothetical protein
MSLKTHLQAWSDLYARYKQIFAAWHGRCAIKPIAKT